MSFLDFESCNAAIPLFDGSSPYSQIPFRYSLHLVENECARPRLLQYLHRDPSDPRPQFMRCLRENLPATGSIVVYNASFEKTLLRECCESLPEFEDWRKQLDGRFVDLLNPFRAFDFYHPDQRGSASIKDVLPVLTGGGYEALAIQDGGAASRAYLAAVFGDASGPDRERVFAELEAYCGLDTSGMIEIVGALKRMR